MIPLTPIAPPCSHYAGVWIGGEHRSVPGSRCAERSTHWLVGPDGEHAPGGYYCEPHAQAIIDEYAEKLGERWTAAPLVGVCAHSRDPRLCAECRPHDLEADTPPERGDYECRRCGAIATCCGSSDEANEKLGPCRPHKFGRSSPPASDEKWAPAGAGDWGCVRCGAWTTYCISSAAANAKMGPCPASPAPEVSP